MVNDGEVVVSSSTASLTAPNGAAISPPPIPPKRSGRGNRIRWSAVLQTDCGMRQFGEPGSMMARRGALHPVGVLKRTRALSRMIRASKPSKNSGRSRSSWNSRLTRIELSGRRNQVNQDVPLACFFLSHSFNFCKVLSSSDHLLIEDSHPLVGISLGQLARVLHKPLLIFEPPLWNRRRDRFIGWPVFRNPHRHAPRGALYSKRKLTTND